MEDLSFLVKQTFKDQSQDWIEEDEEGWEPEADVPSAPAKPGLFFHVDFHGGTFVIRSLLSDDLSVDIEKIKAAPEDYPTLRLLNEGRVRWHKLNYFPCEYREEAEVLHQRLGMRRFPLKEEAVCNISDPGFNFWFEKNPQGFTLHPKIKNLAPHSKRIGPLLDAKISLRRWSELAQVFGELPVAVEFRQEGGSLCFQTEEAWLSEAFEKIFLMGEFSSELSEVFKLLAKRTKELSVLETTWYFLQEAALARRFWMKVESELDYWS